MALGYCKVCDTLRTINPGSQKWGTRERTWYPVAHYVLFHVCNTDDENARNPVQVIDEVFVCPWCGPVPSDSVKELRCPGEKKSL